ncbi:MAG: dihydroorotase [Oscillospiraceae bacterium]|nr:dihydroorotase [Ruminococcus sp.]MCD8345071.1 dihydroorotase [Oscillospiraceae bacterium]
MGGSFEAMKSVGLSEKSRLFAGECLCTSGFAPSYPENYIIVPGLCDVHVHFREPGFSYKETIRSGSLAAKAGGYTTVCTMPNLNPVPDSLENLKIQLDIIEKDAAVRVLPYGAITKGELGKELSDMEAMAPYVCAFSDDGHGVQNDEMMRAAMLKAKSLGKIIAAHCEDNSLLNGGYIHDGEYCRAHGHKGISSESEYRQIERDLRLAEEAGASYHVCHISTKESVQLIRDAKKRGVDVTCETGPHYLVLCDEDLQEDGRFKMNPPLRSRADKEALIEGILDGTIDMIATDHAPHSKEEKSRGLQGSAMGIVGLETAFPVLYTELVRKGVITLEKLIELMSINPRKRFGITEDPGFAVFEIATPYTIDPDGFKTMGRATPFAGWEVYGKCEFVGYDERP